MRAATLAASREAGLGRLGALLGAENAVKILGALLRQGKLSWWKRAAVRVAIALLSEVADDLREEVEQPA